MTIPLPRAGKVVRTGNAPDAKEEAKRLQVLQHYQILDTKPETAFDEITRLAAYQCECPVAAISFTDEFRHWYKSRVGVMMVETPRNPMAGSMAQLAHKPVIIEDTKSSKRAINYPLASDPNVRFYAGVPLVSQNGLILGLLSVVDYKPRQLAAEPIRILEALSRQIINQLDLRLAMIERDRAVDEVRRLNQDLERLVEGRTDQLNKAYESLKAEIDDRKDLQAQVVQVQKMEAVGRLAGGIAHDFNNILLVINGYSDLLVAGAGATNAPLEYLLEIQKAGKRGSALTRQLLTFSRRQIVEPRVFDLNETIDALGGMLKRLIGQHIQFEANKGDAPQLLRADVGQVEQVVMNLVINACDAMPDGGRLTLETSSVRLRELLAHDGGEIQPGTYTVLSVCDSGTGIPPEVKARIFEPFFTTKPEGKGTGLGLATCFGIVQQSNGHITCDTAVGQGTTFRVYLPTPDTRVMAAMTVRLPVASQRGTGTILLVEDDESVCKLTSLMLESFGYEVLEAHDGKEALQFIQGGDRRIDLLLSDLNMPNMSGWELAERVMKLRPGIKCMLMSGNTDDERLSRSDAKQTVPYLQKPFTPEQLSGAVKDALKRAPAIA